MQKPFTPPIAITDTHLGKINAFSGTVVDLQRPTEDMINIDDIAHALSNICRFGGHCSPFFSVAQHSVLVAALAPDELKLAALLHDAPEAYLGDVISPLKKLLKNYAEYEAAFEIVIGNKFGINKAALVAVKQYDLLALHIEHEALQCKRPERLNSILREITFNNYGTGWNPYHAEYEFLAAFVNYCKPEPVPMPFINNAAIEPEQV